MKSVIIGFMAVAGLTATATAQVVMQEIARVDLRAFFDSTNPQGLGTNINGVAWNGTDLYVNGFRNTGTGTNSGILRVNTPLSTGTSSTAAFGSLATVPSRGYTGLDIDGDTLVATWDNGSNSGNSLQAFNLTAGNSLRWNAGTSLGTSQRGFAGPSFNPGINATGGLGSGVSFVFQSTGSERVLNTSTGAANASPSGFLNGSLAGVPETNGQTAFRDLDFNPATGDAFLRINNNVVKAVRTGAGQYNGGNLSPMIVDLADSNQTATNIQFLDTAAFGNVILFNDRASTANGQIFGNVMRACDVNGVAQTLTFLNSAGGAFAPFGTGNAGYDYSFNSATQTLAISDFANSQVYIFQIPTPAGAALLGLGGLMAARRRR